MWRHGDVFIESFDQIPKKAKRLPHTILAKGELTGHSHRAEGANNAVLYQFGDEQFLEVTVDSVNIVHQEHDPITLDHGIYRVWIQREYTPEEIRRVID